MVARTGQDWGLESSLAGKTGDRDSLVCASPHPKFHQYSRPYPFSLYVLKASSKPCVYCPMTNSMSALEPWCVEVSRVSGGVGRCRGSVEAVSVDTGVGVSGIVGLQCRGSVGAP